MNAHVKIPVPQIDLEGCAHWSQDLPYKAVVAVGLKQPAGPMLYQVAGNAQSPCKAENALREATKVHGGKCFYCKKPITPKGDTNLWGLDHVEAKKHGGKSHLGNLVIAHVKCNRDKGHKVIDSYNPTAAAEWLKGLQRQVQRRLAKLDLAKEA